MSHTLSAPDLKALSHLLNHYLLETKQPPHAGSKQLFIADQPCGWVRADAAKALESLPSIRVNTQSVHLGLAAEISANQTVLNDLLAQAAITLKEAGCCIAWRNELLDVWAGDVSIGAIERGVVRPLGLTTRAVHLNAYNSAGQLWVARRALNKPTDPGLWDTLVGGLVGYRESDDLALVRETDEEAGLSPEQIKRRTPIRQITVMQRQLPEGYQVERVLTSECELADDCIPVNQDGEVMTIRCIDPLELVDMLHHKLFTTEASIVIAEDLCRRARLLTPNL